MDFGLAKVGKGIQLTKEHSTLGTAAYMSPEQARGEEVDLRSDIWSFGVVLYEMLTASLPFKGDYEQAVIYSILNEEPKPIENSPFQQIVKKLLSKSPEERYKNIDNLLEDLRLIKIQSGPEKLRKDSIAKKTSRNNILYLLTGIVFIIALMLLLKIKFFSDKQTGEINSIAVLPFDNFSKDTEQEYFIDGMTEAITLELSKISALEVISRTSVMQYKDSKKSIPEIAQELDVDALVEGSVLLIGDQVRITTQLIDAVSDKHLWAEQYDRELRDILKLHSEVARQIADQIKVEITQDEETRLRNAVAVNSAAYETYLLGQHYFRKGWENLWQAIEYFERAIEIDSTFAAAYAGLALSYAELGKGYNIIAPHDTWPKVRQTAEKAVGLNEGLAEAHTALALVNESEWNWVGAESEYKWALELNPNSVEVLREYGDFLQDMGRTDKAMEHFEKSIKLDPYSLRGQITAIRNLIRSGQTEEAIQLIRNKIKSDPGEPEWYWRLAATYAKEGNYEAAIKQLQIQIPLMKGDIVDEVALQGYLYGRLGRKKDAFKMLQILEQLSTKQQYVSPALKAWIYSGLNDKDKAFAWLTRAYETRAHRMGLDIIRFNYVFEPIRDDHRFEELLQKMNLNTTKSSKNSMRPACC
jgi:TolB-like protein